MYRFYLNRVLDFLYISRSVSLIISDDLTYINYRLEIELSNKFLKSFSYNLLYSFFCPFLQGLSSFFIDNESRFIHKQTCSIFRTRCLMFDIDSERQSEFIFYSISLYNISTSFLYFNTSVGSSNHTIFLFSSTSNYYMDRKLKNGFSK